MSIVAQSPSNRSEIAEFFVRDAATLLLRSARSCYALYVLATSSLRPTRFCGDYYSSIVNLGAYATIPLRSFSSGPFQAWFKYSPKVDVAVLDSRSMSERIHSHEIEE